MTKPWREALVGLFLASGGYQQSTPALFDKLNTPATDAFKCNRAHCALEGACLGLEKVIGTLSLITCKDCTEQKAMID